MDDLISRQVDLKPCPFCGSDGILHNKYWCDAWIVECSNSQCPASYMIGWDYDTKEEAISAWNYRACKDEREN